MKIYFKETLSTISSSIFIIFSLSAFLYEDTFFTPYCFKNNSSSAKTLAIIQPPINKIPRILSKVLPTTCFKYYAIKSTNIRISSCYYLLYNLPLNSKWKRKLKIRCGIRWKPSTDPTYDFENLFSIRRKVVL